MTQAPNYDRTQFAVEFDNRPWIIGTTSIGNHRLNDRPLPAAAATWLALTDDTITARWETNLTIEDGVLVPQGTSCTITTTDVQTAQHLPAAALRVTYNALVHWAGTVRREATSLTPDDRPSAEPIQARSVILASDWVEDLNDLTLTQFSAPEQLALDRLRAVFGAVTGDQGAANRMPATPQPITDRALALAAAALQVAQAFIRLDPVTGRPQIAALAWTGAADWNLGAGELTNLDLATDPEDSLTSVTVTSIAETAPDQHAIESWALDNPIWPRHAEVSLDVLPVSGPDTVLRHIAQTWPLHDGALRRPQAASIKITPAWDDPIGGAGQVLRAGDVLHLDLGAPWQYDAVVLSAQHSVTPHQWTLELDLGPFELRSSYGWPLPWPVENLAAVQSSPISCTLTWDPLTPEHIAWTGTFPTGTGVTTGFTIRRAAGLTPPATLTDGIFVTDLGSPADLLITSPGVGTWSFTVFSIGIDPRQTAVRHVTVTIT